MKRSAALLTVLLALPLHIVGAQPDMPPGGPYSPIFEREIFVTPGESWSECVTIDSGATVLLVARADNPMDEDVMLSVATPDFPLIVAPLSTIPLTSWHRPSTGGCYEIRVSVSKHIDRYVADRDPPLWTQARIEIQLSRGAATS